MQTINVNVSPRAVLRIADALNVEAKKFDKLREVRNDVDQQTKRVWHDAAKELRGWSRQLIGASEDTNRNPHATLVLDTDD